MRLLGHLAQRGARHGALAWSRARNVGRHVDRYVSMAAHLYGHAVRPALHAFGVDTREADTHLKAGYSSYNLLKAQSEAGVRVADGIAAHVRGGYEYRP